MNGSLREKIKRIPVGGLRELAMEALFEAEQSVPADATIEQRTDALGIASPHAIEVEAVRVAAAIARWRGMWGEQAGRIIRRHIAEAFPFSAPDSQALIEVRVAAWAGAASEFNRRAWTDDGMAEMLSRSLPDLVKLAWLREDDDPAWLAAFLEDVQPLPLGGPTRIEVIV